MAPAGHLGLGGAAGVRAALRRAWRGVGRGARGREGEVGELEGGEEGRFGAACTPFARLRRRAQKRHGGIFPVYPWVDPEKRGMAFVLSPPREDGVGCTPSLI